LEAELPVAGLKVEREVFLADQAGLFLVTEKVTNQNRIGRIYNLVQHPSVGPPFLDEHTRFDGNGGRGFAQRAFAEKTWERSAEVWPHAISSTGKRVDVRSMRDADPPVTTFLVEEDVGWLTATSPSSRLLLGYVWDAEDMPWMHLWRRVGADRPWAAGLEFGTAGLHQPGHRLVEQGRIFGRKLFRYIDAGETRSFAYLCFLVEIPEGYAGVESVDVHEGELVIAGSGELAHQIVLALPHSLRGWRDRETD
jgi:hypothetical protein